jgi:hypothetical protein
LESLRLLAGLAAALSPPPDLRAGEIFPNLPGAALVLEGIYDYVMPLWPASLEKSGQGAFRVLLGQNAWIMSYENRDGATSGGRVHETGFTASCDGRNIYVIRHPEPRRLPPETVSRMADIYPGNIPPPVKQDLYNIWLAFISPQVLTNVHGTTRPPNAPDLSLFYNQENNATYEWTRDADPTLFSSLRVRSESRPLTRDLPGSGRLYRLRLPAVFPGGFLMLSGRWSNPRQTQYGVLPTLFECDFFSINEKSRTDTNLYPRMRFVCRVTNSASGALGAIPAGFDGIGPIFVKDHRIATQGLAEVTYTLTNRWSPAVEEWIRQQALSRPKKSLELAALEEYGLHPPWWKDFIVRWGSRVILLLLASLPLYAVVRQRSWKQKESPTQRHAL